MYSDETKDAIPISLSNLFAEKNCKEFLLDTLRNLVKREKKVDAYNRGENVSKDGDPALSFGLNFNKNLTAYSYFEAVLLGKLDDIHTFKPAYEKDSDQEITIHRKSDISVIEKIFLGKDREEAAKFFQNLAMSGFSLKTDTETIFGRIYPSIDLTGCNTEDDDKFLGLGLNLRKKEVLTLEITNPEDISDLEAFKNILRTFFEDYLKEQNNRFLNTSKIFVNFPGTRKVLSLSERKIKEGFLEVEVGAQDNSELFTTEGFIEFEPYEGMRLDLEYYYEFVKDITIGTLMSDFYGLNNSSTRAVAKKLNIHRPYNLELFRYSYRTSSSKEILHVFEEIWLTEAKLPIPECINGDFFEEYEKRADELFFPDISNKKLIPNNDLDIESIPDKIRGEGLWITEVLIHDDKFNVPPMGGVAILRTLNEIVKYAKARKDDEPTVVFSIFRESTSYPFLQKILYDEKYKHIRNLFKDFDVKVYNFGTYNLSAENEGYDSSNIYHHCYFVLNKKS